MQNGLSHIAGRDVGRIACRACRAELIDAVAAPCQAARKGRVAASMQAQTVYHRIAQLKVLSSFPASMTLLPTFSAWLMRQEPNND